MQCQLSWLTYAINKAKFTLLSPRLRAKYFPKGDFMTTDRPLFSKNYLTNNF